jgi:hypothetical protein
MVGAQAMLAIMAACVRALKTLPLIEIVLLRSLAGVILVGSYMLIFNISFRGRQKLDLVWCVFSYTIAPQRVKTDNSTILIPYI